MSTHLGMPEVPAGHWIARGQRDWPDWDGFRAIFDDIFAREYYTNHGPLAQRLEAELARRLGVRHAICMTNEYIALAMCAQALGLSGPVLVPALAPLATVQPLDWAAATPLFCDVDPRTGTPDPAEVERLLEANPARAILAWNPWGDACDLEGLERVAARAGIPLYSDCSQAFGVQVGGREVAGYGAASVFSLHSDQLVSCGEGGVLCTQDDGLAAHVRNIRSNYGMGPPVPVVKTGNGRMSEGQAALALRSLAGEAAGRAHNRALREHYATGLAALPGLTLRPHLGASSANDQNLIVLVDPQRLGLDRDHLVAHLRARGIDAGRGVQTPAGQLACEIYGHERERFPGACEYAARTLELPLGRTMGKDAVERVCAEIARALPPRSGAPTGERT